MSSKFIWELYIIFHEIIKTTHVRPRVISRLEMIAEARFINNKLFGLYKSTYCGVIGNVAALNNGVFF